MVLVYRYRVKSLSGLLNKQSRAVNFVWNFCNDRQKDALKWGRKWLTGFDLNNLTAGSSKELGLLSASINMVCQQYAKSRSQKNKPYLRYRGRRCLGWVPVKGECVKRHGDAFRIGGNTFRVFSSRELPDGKIKDGSSFSQDSRGNWFLNIAVEVDVKDKGDRPPERGIGIDLGLKDFATFSDGSKIEPLRVYRSAQEKLGIAQRARKRKRVAAISSKIRSTRLDWLHKLSIKIVLDFEYIAVGNVNAAGLAKTSMAKSVLDASWSSFRNMLAYKAIRHGAWYEEVNESFTSQTCSSCGAMPDSRPKGIAGLGIREWQCSDCGMVHDRDVNAAINILRRGRATLVAGN